MLKSAVATINRYRTATDHLLTFVVEVCPIRQASNFLPSHAEQFVCYLRNLEVAPNGHPNTPRRPLSSTGMKYVFEVFRTIFNFAIKRHHLPPYSENPFTVIEIDRMPITDDRPFVDLNPDQEERFLELCDRWQMPILLTLMLTGVRSAELTHLLLPDNVDFDAGWLFIRNKPDLGWMVKTRNERKIPLCPELLEVLKVVVGNRRTGTVFVRRRFSNGVDPSLANLRREELQRKLIRQTEAKEQELRRYPDRRERLRLARDLWRDIGAIKFDRLRPPFMRLTAAISLPQVTTPKTLRHMFATALQDANVDPLIRNQLMGHSPAGGRFTGTELGMTGIYTHTRPETMRQQLNQALSSRPAIRFGRSWLQKHS